MKATKKEKLREKVKFNFAKWKKRNRKPTTYVIKKRRKQLYP